MARGKLGFDTGTGKRTQSPYEIEAARLHAEKMRNPAYAEQWNNRPRSGPFGAIRKLPGQLAKSAGNVLSQAGDAAGQIAGGVGELAPYLAAGYGASMLWPATAGATTAGGAGTAGAGYGGSAGGEMAGLSSANGFAGPVAGAAPSLAPSPPGGGPAASGGFDWMRNGIIPASSILSGYLGNNAAQSGIDASQNQYDQTRADLGPYREGGVNAMNTWQDRLNNGFDYEQSPGYAFARDEALKATTRQGQAQGRFNSGNLLAELNDRASGMAAQDYGNEFNRWNTVNNQYGNMAGYGANAAAQTGNFGANAANAQADLYGQGASSINNAVQGGISNYLTYDYLNQNPNAWRYR